MALEESKLRLTSAKVEVEVEAELGNNDTNDKNNPHLNFMKGTGLGDKEQGVGIRDEV